MKIRLEPDAYMPERAHDTDAGLDLRSREDAVVPAGGSAVFDTGVSVELPSAPMKFTVDGDDVIWDEFPTVGLITSKSGLYFKHGVISTGTVDYSYRGSIKVKLSNLGTEDYQVHKGDKISQLVILPILTPKPELVDELSETERGEHGFGSTGR